MTSNLNKILKKTQTKSNPERPRRRAVRCSIIKCKILSCRVCSKPYSLRTERSSRRSLAPIKASTVSITYHLNKGPDSAPLAVMALPTTPKRRKRASSSLEWSTMRQSILISLKRSKMKRLLIQLLLRKIVERWSLKLILFRSNIREPKM